MPSLNGLSDTQEPGVSGESTAAGGIGVRGHAHAGGRGVDGLGEGDTGIGIYGKGGQHAGLFEGSVLVRGEVLASIDSESAPAVLGINSSGIGIHGRGGKYAGFFEGNVAVTGDVFLTGADCAEEFDVAETTTIEPGTVMVLDEDGALHQSQQAYDKRVAGVISGAGDYKPGLILDRQHSQDHRLPIALIGKVYCKVDAEYGPINVGDLLTTSPTLGHAMKAEDPFKAFGAVIGKALRSFGAGQGMIPILIALQ